MRQSSVSIFWIVSAILVTSLACAPNKGTVSVTNKSSEMITRAIVVICGQTLEISNLDPSKTKSMSYRIECEGHYSVNVEFRSGRHLEKNVGYVTSGFDMHHEIVVLDADILSSGGVTEQR